jgi:dienelactone hydrolase
VRWRRPGHGDGHRAAELGRHTTLRRGRHDWGTPRPVQFVERIAGLAYSEPEAEDAWRRIRAFFDRYLASD